MLQCNMLRHAILLCIVVMYGILRHAASAVQGAMLQHDMLLHAPLLLAVPAMLQRNVQRAIL